MKDEIYNQMAKIASSLDAIDMVGAVKKGSYLLVESDDDDYLYFCDYETISSGQKALVFTNDPEKAYDFVKRGTQALEEFFRDGHANDKKMKSVVIETTATKMGYNIAEYTSSIMYVLSLDQVQIGPADCKKYVVTKEQYVKNRINDVYSKLGSVDKMELLHHIRLMDATTNVKKNRKILEAIGER